MRITLEKGKIGDEVVVTLPGGEELEMITTIDLAIRMGEIPRAKIEVVLPAVDVECEADIYATVLPDGKRYLLVEVNDAN